MMKRNFYWYGALLLILAAAVLIAAGIAYGQLHIGFIVIIPVIYGTGPAAILAAVFVFAAFLLFALSAMRGMSGESTDYMQQVEEPGRDATDHRQRRRFGGVVFIGPIPIIFGSDRKIGGYMLVAAIVILILILVSFILGVF